MLLRYTLPEMEEIWNEQSKKQRWLDVELAVIKAKEELGEIPGGIHKLTKGLKVTRETLKRADEIEAVTDHDLIAFIRAMVEQMANEVKPYFHAGLTSYDIEDTALATQMVDSINLLKQKLSILIGTLRQKANEHRRTFMMGRTHGIHAEPTTFGLKLLDWIRTLEKHLEKLVALREEAGVGKLSGAVGTYVLSPKIEELACRELGLEPALISTQVIGRDIHYSYISTLVGIANSLDRYAIEIRNLARTDIGEVAEFKRPGNRGSSAMPAKSLLKNPIKTENISSLAKIMRSYISPAMECELLWHERSLDNSAAERIYLPDASILLHFMLNRFNATMDNLVVNIERMEANINFTKGLVFAQPVMLALADKGMGREEAYELVDNIIGLISPQTFTAAGGFDFGQMVRNNEIIQGYLTHEELNGLFDHTNKVKYIDEVFARFDM